MVRAGQVRVFTYTEDEPPFKVLFVGKEKVLVEFLDLYEEAFSLEEIESHSILNSKKKKAR